MLEKCPKCGAKRTSKRKSGLKLNGARVLASGEKVQRYICYGCINNSTGKGFHFSETYSYEAKKIYHTRLSLEIIKLIIDDYFGNNLSISKIAKKHDCSRNTVSKIILKEKILIAEQKKKDQLKPHTMWK